MEIPAPVWEVVARAAAAPCPLSVVLHEKFDWESRCFAPELLSDMSCSLNCSTIFYSMVSQIPAMSLDAGDIRSPFSTRSWKGKNKVMLPKEMRSTISKVFVGPVCLCNSA